MSDEIQSPSCVSSVSVSLLSFFNVSQLYPRCSADSDPHVRDCIRSYTADYTVVRRNYETFNALHAGVNSAERERGGSPRVSQRQEYEVDVVEEAPPPAADRVRNT